MIKNKSMYKKNSLTPTIYKLIIDNKFYIGGTVRGLGQRRSQHMLCLKGQRHGNYRIQELYNQGHEVEFEILEFCERDQVLELEQKYLDMYKDDPNCLNIAFVAGSQKGVKRTKEHRKALSEGCKKSWRERPQVFTEERRAKASNTLKEGFESGRLKPHCRGRGPGGERCALSKLKEVEILEIYQLRRQGMTHKNIAMMYNVTREAITLILNGKCWKELYKKHFKPEDTNAQKKNH